MEGQVGRPTVMTPEVLEKLREAFLMGCTDTEACLFANIGRTTLFEYERENPDFRTLKDEWKENPTLLARKTVYENLTDKQNAQWYLERKKKKEFSPRQELTGEDGEKLKIVFDSAFTQQAENNRPESGEVQGH